MSLQKLPMHFFTIVLNGKPFIRYHIEILKQLPFDWHWHIVEGVAELNHDTAWSLASGGKIPEDFHQDGLSVDGTTNYCDELKQAFSERVTIYRKPKGQFWDGKIEMIQQPTLNIHDESLLVQLDVDELWAVEQLIKVRELFLKEPKKNAAYFTCDYFVGKDRMIATKNTYGNYSSYEWLRVWRFQPGQSNWISHEPPILKHQKDPDYYRSVFTHDETEKEDLIFQHHAYTVESQLRFKESYYGYHGAVDSWKRLQQAEEMPIFLRDFFPWVKDTALVVKATDIEKESVFDYDRSKPVSWLQKDVLDVSDLDKIPVSSKSLRKKKKNILVVSHERSGTHFLINSIAFNFPYYDEEEISLVGNRKELVGLFHRLSGLRETRIFKSHHQFSFFSDCWELIQENFHVFYIDRALEDVLTSCWFYFNYLDNPAFPQTRSVSELLTINPSKYSFDDLYSEKRSQDMVERWYRHVSEWKEASGANFISYEALKNDFTGSLKMIAQTLQMELPQKAQKPTLLDRSVVPRKGEVGDGNKYFTLKDREYLAKRLEELRQMETVLC